MAHTVWKGHMSFGIVSIPVKLSCAARAESISFRQLRASDKSPVGQKLVAKVDGTEVERKDIVKGYEVAKDCFVILSEDEIKAAAPESSRTMELLEFVESSAVDSVYLESSYYLAPEEAGLKAYALLFRALKESGRIGIARAVMTNREHVVIVRPGRTGLLLHTMYYQDEVRASDEYRIDTGMVSDKEAAMAQALIGAMASDFEPAKYADSYRSSLLATIQAKQDGTEVATPKKAAASSNVLDIMAALEASIERKKVA